MIENQHHSCAVIGLDGAIVEIEVDTANGLPSFVEVVPNSQRRSPAYGKAGEADRQDETRLKASLTLSHRHPDFQMCWAKIRDGFDLQICGPLVCMWAEEEEFREFAALFDK